MSVLLYSRHIHPRYFPYEHEQITWYFKSWVPKWLAWIIAKFLESEYSQITTMSATRGQDIIKITGRV